MKQKFTILLSTLLLLCFCLIVGCRQFSNPQEEPSKDPDKPTPPTEKVVPVEQIRIAAEFSSQFLLSKHAPKTLTLTVAPANASNKTVTWSSNNPEAVSVNSQGIIEALTDEGTAIITATAQDGTGVFGNCKVTIVSPAAHLGGDYRLEWSDEFSTSSESATRNGGSALLDESRWIPHYLPSWTTPDLSAPNYTIEDGILSLRITEKMGPWSPYDDQTVISGIMTGNNAGLHNWTGSNVEVTPQTRQETLVTKYGYFELRAKVQTGGGIHSAWWMIGMEDEPHQLAEIDIFEILGKDHNKIQTVLHPWTDPNITYEKKFHTPQGVDLTEEFHIYGMDWYPGGMDFYFDGEKYASFDSSPNYEMLTILSLYEKRHGGWTGPFDPSIAYPKTFDIDYFRMYKRAGGYYESKAPYTLDVSGELEVEIGDTTQLSTLFVPTSKATSVTWKSHKENVASITNNGVVTGKALGKATVTVITTDSYQQVASCVVHVVPKTFKPGDNVAMYADSIVTTSPPENPHPHFPQHVVQLSNAIDGDPSTAYQSSMAPTLPATVTLIWDNGQNFDTVDISATYAQKQGPKSWDIEVSQDGETNWVTLASSGNVMWLTSNDMAEKKSLSFEKVADHKGLRIIIHNAHLDWNVFAINEIEVYENLD